MIAIVDNGKGAEDIARFIRGQKEVISPTEALKSKANAFILSDGDMKHQKHNVDLIKKTSRPLLGIGAGYAFLGVAFGAKLKETKFDKTDRAKIEHPCPLTLDLKKMFTVMQTCKHAFPELPENFHVVASSPKYEYKIISENDKPFFGVHFNPELGGDGLKIIDNFVKFVDVWEKYHREKRD
jgi:GMP synthase-like glutamine amidotransferase